MKSVALGSKATVTVNATRKGDPEAFDAAVARFRRKDDRSQIGRDLRVTLKSGKGVADWIGAGCKDDELECEVTWEILVQDEIHKTGELRVYRPTIEVVAEDEAGGAIVGARACLRMSVRADARTQFGLPDDTRVVCKDTSSDGTAKFNYLPSTRAKLGWEPPWELVKWTKNRGATRKATLKKSPFVLAAVEPATGSRRQWVNVPADPAQRELGAVLKIDVRGHAPHDPATDAGAKQTYYVEVERSSKGSLRTTDTSPALGEQVLEPGDVATRAFELDPNHTGTLEVDLGEGGGDVFTVRAGSTVECSDLSWTIETWRRLHVHLLQPMPAMNVSAADLATMKARVETVLRDGYIEIAWHGPGLLKGNAGCLTVPQATMARMGFAWASPGNYCVFQGGADTGDRLEFRSDVVDAMINDREPRIYVVLCHLFARRVVKEVTLEFQGRRSGWKSIPVAQHEGIWSPTLLDGSPSLIAGPRGVAHYQTSNGSTGWVAASDFEIDEGAKKYRVTLNDETIRSSHDIVLRFKLAYTNTLAGSSSGKRISVVWRPDKTAEHVGHSLAHEIGHSLGQAATSAPSMRFPGITSAHPFAHTGRNYEGSHCFYGLPKKYHSHPNFQKLTFKGKHGSCVMWGGVAPGFDFARAARLCEHCQMYLRAAACDPTRV